MIAVERYTGGRQRMVLAGGLGAAGLLLTAVGAAVSAKEAAFSYAVAFGYGVGISVCALILLCIHHAVGAKWHVVTRRGLEVIALTVAIFALLFIPVMLGMKELFVWMTPEALSPTLQHHLHHKHLWLNRGGFVGRALLYFGVWIFVSTRLHLFSSKQDEVGGAELVVRQRRLGTGALPFLALTLTFAGVDWLMSFDPFWSSTIFGVYYFAGSFVSAIAVWTLVTLAAKGKDLFGDHVTPAHLHNLGKLLFAFTCFWAYIAFSQFMLIWIANLPEENVWMLIRTSGGWRPLAVLLVLGHFVAPFFLFLSRARKTKVPWLVGMSLWVLLMHLLDVYWVVMPVLHEEGPRFHWTNLTAVVGVAGMAVAYGLFRARGRYAVPVKDPFLADSLRYTQP